MAGYNDLALIIEWLEEHLKEPTDQHEISWAAGRLDLQLRLLYAVMHETLNVLQDIQKQPGSPQLEERLDSKGQNALDFLRQVSNGQDELGRRLLTLSRNKTAYHYDRNQFRESLKRLLERFGHDSATNILFLEGRSGSEQYYFTLADMIRAEITQGLIGAANKEYLDKLLALTRSFGDFMESLLIAYSSDRGLKMDFSFKNGPTMANADPHDTAPIQLFHAPAVWYVIAGGFIVLACGAFLWGVSAASLSCVPCNCTYSVFSELQRCRWPAILGILYWIFLIAAFGSVVAGLLLRRRAKEKKV